MIPTILGTVIVFLVIVLICIVGLFKRTVVEHRYYNSLSDCFIDGFTIMLFTWIIIIGGWVIGQMFFVPKG
jgi:hypothetical protein